MPFGFFFASPREFVSRPNQRPAISFLFESAAVDHTSECRSTVSGAELWNTMFWNLGGSTSSSKRASGPDQMPIHLLPSGSTSAPNGNTEFVNVVSQLLRHTSAAGQLRQMPFVRRETPSWK